MHVNVGSQMNWTTRIDMSSSRFVKFVVLAFLKKSNNCLGESISDKEYKPCPSLGSSFTNETAVQCFINGYYEHCQLRSSSVQSSFTTTKRECENVGSGCHASKIASHN